MSKGDGCIQQLGRDYWRVRVDFGKDPVTGQRRRVERRIHGSKGDARKMRDQIRREQENGLSVDGGKVTFTEFVEVWHDARLNAGTVSPTTAERDRRLVLTAAPYIGDILMKSIDARTIETLYASIKRDKRAAGVHFGGTSMHKLHVMLKQVFKKAVDYDLILRNPFDRVTAPKQDAPERNALTMEDCARLLSCINEAEKEAYCALAEKEDRQIKHGNAFGRSFLYGISIVSCVMAVRLALATGMRRGEVFGLTWGNVELSEQPQIKVCQALTGYGDIKAPKTKAGLRTVNIDAVTAEHLQKWEARQAAELSKIGTHQSANTPVCCSNVGSWFDMNNFERWWRPWRKENDFSDLKFHELRHTQATQLLANGVDVKTVQTRMGHASASITLDWYSHAIPENDRKAADLLGELFSQKPESTPILQAKIG